MDMESTSDKEREGLFLKIDTVWSEAEANLVIKEEIVSDVEPDCIPSTNENSSDADHQSNPLTVVGEGENFSRTLLSSWQAFKKKLKTKNQSILASEARDLKSSCPHDTKNFKIIKRRLRCGDCRSLVCPECCKIMPTNLQNHFLGSDMKNTCNYSCKLCSIPFNSLCALQAHIRIHTLDTPYVCPDCGLIYNNIYFLILHLINKCYHVYKIVRYKCKNCPGSYFTSEAFVRHIQQSHIENIFRCLYCSSLFSSSNEFNDHMENVHQKQKLQYLNYFKCSLCSNMVIPKFMYQKHITQHCENSESCEVNYQCLCDEIYSLIGAFRAHIQHCNDKGALPPQWNFLKKNLKTHELPFTKNLQTKDASSRYPTGNSDPSSKKLCLRPTDENVEVNDDDKVKNCESFKNNCDKSIEKASNSNKSSDNGEIKSSEKVADESNKGPLSSNVTGPLEIQQGKKLLNNLHLGKTDNDEPEILKIYETPNIQSEVEYPKETNMDLLIVDTKKKNQQNEEGIRENDTIDADLSKTLYHHIPCDHLGYLSKTHCREPLKKESPVGGDPLALEKRFSPQKYNVITELNERTGLITTRKVPIENVDDDVIEENQVQIDDSREEIEGSGSRFYGVDKNKYKSKYNMFNCPFCVVVFPKHGVTFQQFRLHLEAYHPTAAINITLKKEDNDEPSHPKEPVSDNNNTVPVTEGIERSLEDKCNEESGKEDDSQNLCEEKAGVKKKEDDLENTDMDCSQDELSSQDASSEKPEGNKTRCDEGEKDNSTENVSKLNEGDKENKGKNFCWTMELSLVGKDKEEEKAENNLQASATNREKENECSTSFETSKGESDADGGKEHRDTQNGSSNTSAEVSQIEERDTSGCSVTIIEERLGVEGDDKNGNEKEKEKEKAVDFKIGKGNASETGDKPSLNIPSDYDEEWDTSNHSNWSAGSIAEYIPDKDSSMESKTEEKERSRRESEVWSEFYESLKLAEKLKKKPEELSDRKKKSVVSDYSSKRIVKKPKRYRESSESGDSACENENSDSDDEFRLSNDLADALQAKEKSSAEGSATDDQSVKKQKLLRKLENVDSSFVDYLYDLVNKREKYFKLYKKHSSLRANRYNSLKPLHDLRSYRKKILNGIKHRGRPHKVINYQDLIKKKDPIQPEDRNVKETAKKELTRENKPVERKRGRPRKILEPGKLKERRRSDKEVDFIEKNFEREESDLLSPNKRKRKLSSKLQYFRKITLSEEKDDFSSGQVISNKPLDSSKKFSCAVCKQLFQDTDEFREHIRIHRMEENSYQCMECGECFVVRPSLEKHLHAFHKIKNTDKYIKDNECCNIKKEVAEVDNEPLKENQCKVCKDQFERAIDLTKHFRIHGMAFLKEFRKDGNVK